MFSLAYDTVTNSLTQTGSFTPHGGHPWLSWGPDRSMLYGAERDGWSSYSVTANNEITFRSNLTLRGRCDGRDFKHGTTSILAEQKAPFNIYGAGRSPCGNVMATRVDGSLERIVQNITYQPESRVHGMALDPEGSYLYSADTKANGIWIHKVDTAKGTLSRAKFKTHGEANSRPRRLALHPGNKFLYMLLSKTNKLVVYSIKMEANGPVLTDTGLSYNLVAPATPSAAPEPTILEPGFLTAILLNANDGAPSSQPRPINQEPGYPIQMILQVATSTSGGRSNSIAPAPWANDHVVLTDSEKGLVQIWRF
ncbi:3-carboxy-cis,cis-mucoante lactonizing enzyme, partial [Tothia fuscella]